jgi:hypothetical protein
MDDEPAGGAELVEGGRADEAGHAATVRLPAPARLGPSTDDCYAIGPMSRVLAHQ